MIFNQLVNHENEIMDVVIVTNHRETIKVCNIIIRMTQIDLKILKLSVEVALKKTVCYIYQSDIIIVK